MEAGLSDGLAMLHATPFAALVVDSISMPQYSETTVSGSTVMALQSMETSFDRLRGELGLGWNNITGDGSNVIWNGRVGWAHEFNSADKIPLAFAAFPSQPFTITGARLKDVGFVSAGLMVPLAPGVALSGNVEGDFGSTDSYGGRLQLRSSW
jgi:outer membrane autotransporter protein